jgi:hypothetical protein
MSNFPGKDADDSKGGYTNGGPGNSSGTADKGGNPPRFGNEHAASGVTGKDLSGTDHPASSGSGHQGGDASFLGSIGSFLSDVYHSIFGGDNTSPAEGNGALVGLSPDQMRALEGPL